jgi:HemY protein
MKKLILFIILLLGLAAWVLYRAPEDGGYVLIAFGSKTIEMSLWFAALVGFLIGFLVWLVWWLLSGSLSVVKNFGEIMTFGGRGRAQKRTVSGLIDFIEGDWQQAHKKLLRAAPKVDNPLINYLAAARSAAALGDTTEAKRVLALAADTTPDGELAVALTQATIELHGEQYDQCLATLLRIQPQAPQNPVLLDLLRQVYVAQQNWEALQNILERLRAFKILSAQKFEQLEIQVHSAHLSKTCDAAENLVQNEQLPCLKNAWAKIPAALQKKPALQRVYAQKLATYFEDTEAELFIRKALAKAWDADLVYLYGRVRGADSRQQMRIAEDWLAAHPQDPMLLLTLGRLSMRNELWGKARDYFKESLRYQRNPEVYAELARLLESMGEHQRGADYYQLGLGLTIGTLPDLPLPKRLA